MRGFLVKTSVIVIAVLVLLIFLHYTNILSFPEVMFLKILTPMQRGIYDLSRSTPSECQKIQDIVNQLIVENVQLKSLREENDVLRKELNFLKINSYSFIMAHVIGKSPDSGIFILDKGLNSGIKTGLPVIINDGMLIGKIAAVENNISKIMLLTSNQSKWAALLQNQDKSPGIVEGELGLSFKIDLIPQDKLVGQGDLVITSGLEKNVPRGLIIGKVEKITTEPHDLFQSATLKLLTSLDDLNIVAVLLPTD